MAEEGRALSKERGAGFIARTWLENDGDAADQFAAAQRWPGSGKIREFDVSGQKVVHLVGKRATLEFDGCRPGVIIVSSVPRVQGGSCQWYDPRRLRKTGSLALMNGRIVSAQELSGDRLWIRSQNRSRP